MAKKTKVAVEEPQVVEQPQTKRVEPKFKKVDNWEIKDRTYLLKNSKKPLTYTVKSAGLYWFDEELGYEREVKYCENQRTCFVDEMKGDQRLSHIIFRAGVLNVPREKTVLQKFLSLYHPHRDKLFREFKPEINAANEIEILELEADAILIARDMDIDMAEAIKRDLLVFARNNPALFLELASDDNVQLRNFGIKATELGIIKLTSDQRNFLWGSNDRVIMTIPFDEHPYTALAAWFKTDEGMEIYKNIEKRLN